MISKNISALQDFRTFKMSTQNSWGLSWVVVTGASRGFGASICKCLATILGEGSVMVGIARSQENLNNTSEIVHRLNPAIKVSYL